MTNTLLNHVQSVFTPSATNDLSDTLNETPAITQKLLDGLLPTVTAGILNKAQTDEGISALHRLLTNTPFATDPSVNQLVETGSHREKAAESGNDLLKKLYDERVDQVPETAAQYSGASVGSATVVTGLVASILMGYLHRQVTTQNLTEAQLALLLRGEANGTRLAVPAAMAGPLGWFIGLGTIREVPAAVLANDDKGGFAWLPWLLLVLGLIALFWFLTKSCSSDTAKTNDVPAGTDTDTVATAPYGNENGSMAAGDTMPKVRVAVDVPGGRKLLLADSSFNYELAQYLATADQGSQPNRVFFFDDLTFPVNTDRLDESSRDEVNNFIEIMKAYPSMNVRIVGHTDSQGPESINQPLSEARAEAVKTALVNGGIDAGRITTRHRGETEPIATNQTAAGRRENRRIDVMVTKL